MHLACSPPIRGMLWGALINMPSRLLCTCRTADKKYTHLLIRRHVTWSPPIRGLRQGAGSNTKFNHFFVSVYCFATDFWANTLTLFCIVYVILFEYNTTIHYISNCWLICPVGRVPSTIKYGVRPTRSFLIGRYFFRQSISGIYDVILL